MTMVQPKILIVEDYTSENSLGSSLVSVLNSMGFTNVTTDFTSPAASTAQTYDVVIFSGDQNYATRMSLFNTYYTTGVNILMDGAVLANAASVPAFLTGNVAATSASYYPILPNPILAEVPEFTETLSVGYQFTGVADGGQVWSWANTTYTQIGLAMNNKAGMRQIYSQYTFRNNKYLFKNLIYWVAFGYEPEAITDAHTQTTIPIKTCFPIDQNTTFLAHYDVTNEESLRGITPNLSNTTLRPIEGPFGGCLAIEQGTTNLHETQGGGASQDWTKWSHYGNTTYWSSSSQYQDWLMGMVFQGVVPATATQSYLYDYYPYTFTANQAYTMSIYLKSDTKWSGQITAYLNDSNGNAWLANGSAAKTVTLNSQWQRFEFNITPTSAPTGTGGIGYYFTSPPQGATIYAAMPQLEALSFGTSFVKGTRSTGGGIQYPKYVANPYEGTAFFYINLISPPAWNRILGIGSYSSPITTDEFRLFLDSTTGNSRNLYFEIQSGNSANTVSSGGTNILCGKWNCIALTWSNTNRRIRLYVNGVKVKEVIPSSGFIFPDYSGYNNITIGNGGSADSSSMGNGNYLLGELRIDKIERTPDEIMQWYQSNAPFFPRGVHQVYL
jgi:Concanavalin A-like lectin/glucanases superfamily